MATKSNPTAAHTGQTQSAPRETLDGQPATPVDVKTLLEQYGCGPIPLVGTANGLYERHLIFDNAIEPSAATPRDRFEAFACAIRDILTQRWVHTEQTYAQENPKRAYYLSMEF